MKSEFAPTIEKIDTYASLLEPKGADSLIEIWENDLLSNLKKTFPNLTRAEIRLAFHEWERGGHIKIHTFPNDTYEQHYRFAYNAQAKKTQQKSVNTSPKLYWITLQNRNIILNTKTNRYTISRLQFARDNEIIFEYIFHNPKTDIAKETVAKKLQKVTDFNKFVAAIGFNGELRKAFFNVSKNTIKFIAELTIDDLEDRLINLTELDKKIAKLKPLP